VWTNTNNTNVLFGGDQDFLDWGDGTPPFLVPEQQNRPSAALPNGVSYAVYPNPEDPSTDQYVTHTYAREGVYTISYREPNRNAGILNFDASVNTTFYVETKFTLVGTETFTSPTPLHAPIFFASTNDSTTMSIAAVSSDPEVFLYYVVTTPLSDRRTPVLNFKLPENFSVNLHNGLIRWDGKFQGNPTVGEYLFAVKIYIVKNDAIIGYVMRDYQIILDSDKVGGRIRTEQGSATDNRIYVPENETRSTKILLIPESTESVSYVIASELEKDVHYQTTMYDSTVNEKPSKVVKLDISNVGGIVRDNPFIISIRATFQNENFNSQKDRNFTVYTKDVSLGSLPTYTPPPPDETVGVEDDLAHAVLAPNPFTTSLQFTSFSEEIIEVQLVNTKGQLHSKFSVTNGQLIDVADLPAGLYVARIFSMSTRTFKYIKLVKKY
jgi:hypothetical protein